MNCNYFYTQWIVDGTSYSLASCMKFGVLNQHDMDGSSKKALGM